MLMHICQDINTWDQPMSHWSPTHDHLGIPLAAMTRPRPGREQSILSVTTQRPGWRCWHDPSRGHRPSIPETTKRIPSPHSDTRSNMIRSRNGNHCTLCITQRSLITGVASTQVSNWSRSSRSSSANSDFGSGS